MSTLVLTGATIWVAQYDLTSDTNNVAVKTTYEDKDKTNFGSGGARERLAGISSTSVDIDTFLNTAEGQSEAVTAALNGTSGILVTVCPDGTAGGRAYLGRHLEATVEQTLKVGEVAALKAGFLSSNTEGMVGGTLIVPKTTAGATANGTAYQVGAASSTQTVHAALHVFAGSGTLPTLDVKIQSDTSGFASATDRITFTQATGATSEYKNLAGPITDDYWRAVYTIGGTGPSFTFAVALSIANTR